MSLRTARGRARPRVPLRHGEGNKDHLSSSGGLAALSLDALSSVAYGPEAIVVVLVAAGTSALRLTLPVTLAITGLLVVLVISYCQAVHPDGGGAYAVGKKDLGATVSLLAASCARSSASSPSAWCALTRRHWREPRNRSPSPRRSA
jgi:hypothetical protein